MSDVIRIPKPGDIIAGQFRLEQEIGRGGFGVVYQAQQIGIERRVAVKMLLPHAMTHQGVAERFRREAQLASSLTHPNSIAIYAFGIHSKNEKEEMGLPFIAMEYLNGETLHEFLGRHGRLGLTQTVTIIKQALGSLAEAHQRSIVHRDLKPENIFLVKKGNDEFIIKVLDFGIAKAIDSESGERLTRTGMVTGTAEYMAPEQAQGFADITPALDVYAMGCITYQLLIGSVPFDGNSPMNIAIKHIAEPIPDLPEYYQDHFIGHTIRKAMAKDPAVRFQSAAEFLDTLNSGKITTDDGLSRSMEPVGPIVPTVVPDSGKIKLNIQAEPSRPRTVAPELANSVTDPSPAPIIAPSSSESSKTLIIAAIFALFILILGGGAVSFFLSQNGDTTQDTDAQTPSASKSEPPKETNPSKEDALPKEAKTVVENTPDPKETEPPTKETPKENSVVIESPQTLTLTSDTPASVWKEDVKLGDTPLELERKEDETNTRVELRAVGFAPKEVILDWENPQEDDTVRATLTPLPKKEAHASNTPRAPKTRPKANTSKPPKTKPPTNAASTKPPKKETPKKTTAPKEPKKSSPKLFGTPSSPKVFN